MALDDSLGQREAQASAPNLASTGLIEASKPFEHPLAIGQSDTGPVVVDREVHRAPVGDER